MAESDATAQAFFPGGNGEDNPQDHQDPQANLITAAGTLPDRSRPTQLLPTKLKANNAHHHHSHSPPVEIGRVLLMRTQELELENEGLRRQLADGEERQRALEAQSQTLQAQTNALQAQTDALLAQLRHLEHLHSDHQTLLTVRLINHTKSLTPQILHIS